MRATVVQNMASKENYLDGISFVRLYLFKTKEDLAIFISMPVLHMLVMTTIMSSVC